MEKRDGDSSLSRFLVLNSVTTNISSWYNQMWQSMMMVWMNVAIRGTYNQKPLNLSQIGEAQTKNDAYEFIRNRLIVFYIPENETCSFKVNRYSYLYC